MRKWIMQNPMFFFLIVFSTSFFLYQHTTGLSWDFSVYLMNAKYHFANGHHIEWARPPLTSLIFATFSVFGWIAAEFLYIVFVSMLFAFSVWKLAGKLKFNKNLLYALLLTPFVLTVGLSVGSELLTLSLLILLIVYLNSYYAGLFIGLLVLTRYTNLTFVSLLFFNALSLKWKAGLKKAVFGIFIAFLIGLPWLMFNYYARGDPFTSIGDAFALNMVFRDAIVEPPNFAHILKVGSYLLVFAPIGIYSLKKKIRKMDLIMLAILILTLYSYLSIDFKYPRILFLMTLPLAYFSYKAFSKVEYKSLVAVAIISMSIILASASFVTLKDPTPYQYAIADVADCGIYSDEWVPLNALGLKARPLPFQVEPILNDGSRLILFHQINKESLLIYEDFKAYLITDNVEHGYIILGDKDKCTDSFDTIEVFYLDIVGEYDNQTYRACDIVIPINSVCDALTKSK